MKGKIEATPYTLRTLRRMKKLRKRLDALMLERMGIRPGQSNLAKGLRRNRSIDGTDGK